MTDTSTPLTPSPLHSEHQKLGAKFASFAGWEMPIEYAEHGVLAEHAATRNAVGVFDVSHLGKVLIAGDGAAEFLNRVVTNDLRRITPGRAQYTMVCDEESGGVLDDLIVYLHDEDRVFCIPNAANTSGVVERLIEAAPSQLTIENQHRDFAVIAVQGPHSPELLARLKLLTPEKYMSFLAMPWGHTELTVCRTGYTGERGYELVSPADAAPELWQALFDAGEDLGITPAGLGARDTLRTEMGYPLHGQDLSAAITPVQARASWAVGWKKPEFWGRDALLAEKEGGAERRSWGFTVQGRGIPRGGMEVFAPDGERSIGRVTSGTFSPTLRQGIGLALISTAHPVSQGDTVEVEVRGRRLTVRIQRPPFVESNV